MTPLFADTGYWIALLDPADDLHAIAVRRSREVSARPIVTTDLVLVELFNDFAGRGSHYRQLASRMVAALEESRSILIIEFTRERFRNARERFEHRPDKNWSLTDCDSMLACVEMGIIEVLAYDHHFVQAGFTALLREP